MYVTAIVNEVTHIKQVEVEMIVMNGRRVAHAL